MALTSSQLASVGNLLKEARELREESLSQVATRIALTPAQLRAIEAGDLQPFYSAKYYDQAASRYAEALGVALPDPAVPEQLSLLREVETGKAAVAQPAPEAQPTLINPVAPTPVAPPPATSPITANPVATAVSSGAASDAPAAQLISPKTWLIAAALALIMVGVVKVGTNQAPQPQLSVASPTPPVTSSVAADAPAAPALSETKAPSPTVQTAAAPTPATRQSAGNARLDSHLEAKASTWVQIVNADGSKNNLRLEPGERVEFNQGSTAALAFGKPGQVSLSIAGKTVDVQPYVLQTSPARALVIISQLKN